MLNELPVQRMQSSKCEQVTVDSGSLIQVKRNMYSLSSRSVSEQVEVLQYMDLVGVW